MRGGCTPGGIETITGLSISDGRTTPQNVYLAVDSDKVCYVILPSGEVLTSTAGVINYDWTGNAGRVKLIVPKNTSTIGLTSSDFNIKSKFVGKFETIICDNHNLSIDIRANSLITSVVAKNATIVDITNSTGITSVVSGNAINLYALGCSLTAKSIGDFLFAAAANNPTASGVANFAGGNNATYSSVSNYIKATYNPFVGADYVGVAENELLAKWIFINLNKWDVQLIGGISWNEEIITGLSIGDGTVTPQRIRLSVNSGYCSVVLPNGEIIKYETEVDYNWTGSAGSVKLIIPKDATIVRLSDSNLTGDLLLKNGYNFNYILSSGITNITLPNIAGMVNIQGSIGVTSLVCPKAVTVFASTCSLTAKSIGDFLFAAAANNSNVAGTGIFTGGNNATYNQIESYMSQFDIDILNNRLDYWIENNLSNWTVTLKR